MSRGPGEQDIIVIGAGPAGLTAALELGRRGVRATVLEADDVVGGISRTVERDGWRFDIGGHRFYTKVDEVEELWHELLGDDLLERSRQSRIFYRGDYYHYPLRPLNALRNLGLVESVLCVLSYLWARISPPGDQSTFEGWVAARFGWRLYHHFFKTYTEKVWGVPATELSSDWAAQRIRTLSLGRAVLDALRPTGGDTPTSLIGSFLYPRHGPGMMWERCREEVEAAGSKVVMRQRVTTVHRRDGRAVAVEAEHDGAVTEWDCGHLISSMPLADLVRAMDPPPPEHVLAAADGLRFRDFLQVALVVPAADAFPDNWIYIHSPDVEVGRIQNFGAWSPGMVRDEHRTCLGLEYFTFAGDGLWESPDGELIALARRELGRLGLVDPDRVEAGYVVRMPKAYPVYDEHYADHVATIRGWLGAAVPNVHPVGRNGMHRYNNQDHSMLTALRTVDNVVGDGDHDVWAVNVEDEYLEEDGSGDGSGGTGRGAPVTTGRDPGHGGGRDG